MTFEECSSCGKHIMPGDLRYVVRVTIVGDDGGVLTEVADPDKEIESLLRQIEDLETYELENDVMEERVFILCSSCKRTFARRPFGFKSSGGALLDDDDFAGPIQ